MSPSLQKSWFGSVPKRWQCKRIKFVVDLRSSNVDKKTKPEETPVRLCNYTDVYYNDRIIPEMELLYATATTSEIKRFGLQSGDVVITKDSESADDIAQPTLIERSAANMVCGYHLALLRPVVGHLRGDYLFWLLKSPEMNAQFQIAANGVTRFGLPTTAIASVQTIIPLIEDQKRIARFLDYCTTQLDALIAMKQQLLDKLAEKRSALITRAVTNGLNPDAPMKDSGVAWLGEIPAHWTVSRLRFETTKIEQGWSPQCESRPSADDEWGVLKVGCVNADNFDETENKVLPDEFEPKIRYQVMRGDILISRANTKELLGSAALVSEQPSKLLVCDKLYRVTANADMDPRYLVALLRSAVSRFQYEREATGTSGSMQNIGQDTVKNVFVPGAPKPEQEEIADFLAKENEKSDQISRRIRQAVTTLTEYRTALITAAVTGQIDVRDWQPPEGRADAV